MEKNKLSVRLREDMSKAHLKEMRRHGHVPGSLYGKGKTTISLEVPLPGLARVLKTDAGVHSILEMDIDGGERGQGGTAVIKAVQKDPLTRKLLQVDFERVELSDIIATTVPVMVVGDSIGVREGGMLERVLDHIEVRSRADQIPTHLDIDISNLRIGQFVHGADIPLPEGVELASRGDDIIIALRPPHMHGVPEKESMPSEQAIPTTGGTPPAETSEFERTKD